MSEENETTDVCTLLYENVTGHPQQHFLNNCYLVWIPCLALIGIVGNGISMIALKRQENNDRNAHLIQNYVIAADLWSCVFSILRYVPIGLNLLNNAAPAYLVRHEFIPFVYIYLSVFPYKFITHHSLFITAACVWDRVSALLWPVRHFKIDKVRKARIALHSCMALSFCLCVRFFLGTGHGYSYCEKEKLFVFHRNRLIDANYELFQLSYVILITFELLGVAAASIGAVVLVYVFHSHLSSIRSRVHITSEPVTVRSGVWMGQGPVTQPNPRVNRQATTAADRVPQGSLITSKALTRIIFVQVTTLLFAWVPYGLLMLIHLELMPSFASIDVEVSYAVNAAGAVACQAFNFVFYVCVSQAFRNHFLSVLLRK